RYFDPDIGRFVSEDPIGLWGGLNFYQYAPNADGWIDPWGWARGCPQLARDRRAGVAKAWRQERRLVELTGGGTRCWTPVQKKELLAKGKVKGFEGHHINSAEAHPHLASNPDNSIPRQSRGL
ncbi:MAG: hypothetical protein FWD67_09170, partial [Betaproteobacteria bacterium]|nr:hypothetical protein [Betaproteobacteria bacterium]